MTKIQSEDSMPSTSKNSSTRGKKGITADQESLWTCSNDEVRESVAEYERDYGELNEDSVGHFLELNFHLVRGKMNKDHRDTLLAYKKLSTEATQRLAVSSRKRSQKSLMIKKVLEELENSYIFKTPTDTEELHLYEDGVYVEGKTIVKASIEEILGNEATIGLCSEVIDHFKRRSYSKRDEFNNIATHLPLENGLLNLNTQEIEPHSPERIFTFKLPTIYNPDAQCPQFIEWFNQTIADDEDRSLLQEYAGYTLWPSFPHHQLLFLLGTGRNGKGVFVRTIEGILGKSNVSNIDLEALNGSRRFVLAGLYGRLMNVSSEPRTRYQLETEVIKKVTGDDTIDAEMKGIQKPLKFTSFAKFFVLANRLPRVLDPTASFWDRILIVKFRNRYTDGAGNRIPHIEKRWLNDDQERSGVLNWMLVGLKKLMDNQTFTTSKTMMELKIEFKQASDSVGAFLEDERVVILGSSLNIEQDELYEAYKRYVEDIGGVVESKRVLNDRVRYIPNVKGTQIRKGGKHVRIWRGIAIIDDSVDDDQQRLDDDAPVTDVTHVTGSIPPRKNIPIEKEFGSVNNDVTSVTCVTPKSVKESKGFKAFEKRWSTFLERTVDFGAQFTITEWNLDNLYTGKEKGQLMQDLKDWEKDGRVYYKKTKKEEGWRVADRISSSESSKPVEQVSRNSAIVRTSEVESVADEVIFKEGENH